MVREFELYDIKVVLDKPDEEYKVTETFREQVEGQNVEHVKKEARKYYNDSHSDTQLVDVKAESRY